MRRCRPDLRACAPETLRNPGSRLKPLLVGYTNRSLYSAGMSEVPDELIGVWRRAGILVNGAEIFEDSDVVWIQTRSRYVDVRVPRDGMSSSKEAIAGRQSWVSPRLRFHHELDYTHNYPDDEGELSWDGDTLVESGSVIHEGNSIDFLERWSRITALNPGYAAWEIREPDQLLKGICLKVGCHFASINTLDGFAAAYFSEIEGAWHRQWSVGQETRLDLASSVPLESRLAGEGWQLVEQRD